MRNMLTKVVVRVKIFSSMTTGFIPMDLDMAVALLEDGELLLVETRDGGVEVSDSEQLEDLIWG